MAALFDPRMPEPPHREGEGATRRPLLTLGAGVLLALATTCQATKVEPSAEGPAPLFVDISQEAGLALPFDEPAPCGLCFIDGGLAVADVDDDGLLDLYVVRGRPNANHLFIQQADGTYTEEAAVRGVADDERLGSGPAFVDLDGDGDRDLIVGATEQPEHTLVLRNEGGGTYVPWEPRPPLADEQWITALAAADVDGDEDLDLFVTHHGDIDFPGGLLWIDQGEGWHIDGTFPAQLQRPSGALDINESFAPRFADIDDDGDPDLLVTVDYGQTQVWRNDGAGAFGHVSQPSIDDENGMGSAIGDFDGDLDLDWFVTSIHTPPGVPAKPGVGLTGNRLYLNDGKGVFADTSEAAGVREGDWGWGACAGDFDRDGHLDLFHVTGMQAPVDSDDAPDPYFAQTPARLFLSNGDGTFREAAHVAGIEELAIGGGVACADMDRDGDLDIAVGHWNAAPSLWDNRLDEASAARGWLGVRLEQPGPNREAIGAHILLEAGGRTQLRDIALGSNHLGMDPAEALFGLGDAHQVDALTIRWPDGEVDVFEDLEADRWMVIER